MSGILHVVATPIGNLEDLSPRAARVLREVDVVLAEDTRRTGRLLAHVGSDVAQRSLHEHNERERIAEVLDRLRAGEQVGLVSDAGTPAVSDPGYRVVAACVQERLRVEAVPGPSALLTALVASGLPTDRVAFDGFLPRRGRARQQRLDELAQERRTMVLFVSPHRARQDLVDLTAALGGSRGAVLGRELTKRHEEMLHGTLDELVERVADGVRGELTCVVAGAGREQVVEVDDAAIVARVRDLIATGVPKKEAIATVARTAGRPKRDVYQAVVDGGS